MSLGSNAKAGCKGIVQSAQKLGGTRARDVVEGDQTSRAEMLRHVAGLILEKTT